MIIDYIGGFLLDLLRTLPPDILFCGVLYMCLLPLVTNIFKTGAVR